jgi:hypothetical protein
VLFSQVTGAILRGIITQEIASIEVVVVHKICLEKYSVGKRGGEWEWVLVRVCCRGGDWYECVRVWLYGVDEV